MPETKIPLVRGDRAGIDTEYRSALPKNIMTIMAPVFDVQGFLVIAGQVVAQAAGLTVHPGTAHLLHGNPFTNDHLGHPGGTQVNTGIFVHHDNHIGQCGNISGSCR